MLDHGFKVRRLMLDSCISEVCVFNRTVSKVDAFVCREGKRQNLCGARTAAELVDCLAKPRKIIILVKAGQAVDDFIEILVNWLSTCINLVKIFLSENTLISQSLMWIYYLEVVSINNSLWPFFGHLVLLSHFLCLATLY
ncbi:unnamed protein product [Taenia asiatica]|uniref:NAD_binding_2 domain-containing protein n=1 Tax=Taenia asiatica TaxID=60517 RepID=A0A0R3VXS3_TAEAS|nr:unnamed protein product [Taenia asiatica]